MAVAHRAMTTAGLTGATIPVEGAEASGPWPDSLTVTRVSQPTFHGRFSWCPVTQALDVPLGVVGLDEGHHLLAEIVGFLTGPGPKGTAP